MKECTLPLQLVQESCFSTAQYLVTHNVSSDQSPITTNSTNVTLYGVRPGETYTVEIIPYNTLFRRGEPLLIKISKSTVYHSHVQGLIRGLSMSIIIQCTSCVGIVCYTPSKFCSTRHNCHCRDF